MSSDNKMAVNDELLRFCKIVSIHNGYVDIKPDNLTEILDNARDVYHISSQTPVAILAIIGTRGSGKSLFTNFLIQYLRSGCVSGWWSSVKTLNEKRKPIGPGFSWGSVTHSSLFQPVGSMASTSGVYLWPEPFFMEKNDGGKVLVWVLHMHVVENGEKDVYELEKFLLVACSRVMEIHVDGDIDNEIRILNHYWNILQKSTDPDTLQPKQVCDSIVYVIRSPTNKTTTATVRTNEDAKEELLALSRHSDKVPVDKSMLDHFQHVNVTWMKESPEKLHDSTGIFYTKVMKVFSRVIKNVVDTMMEESEVVEKKTNLGQGLTLGEMYNFLITTANTLSTGKRGVEQRSLQSEKLNADNFTDRGASIPISSRDQFGREISQVQSIAIQTSQQQNTRVSTQNHFVNFVTYENMDVDDTVAADAAEQMEVEASNVDAEKDRVDQAAEMAELKRRRWEDEEAQRRRQHEENAKHDAKMAEMEARRLAQVADEEAQRRRQQEARSVMDECVSTAVSQIQQMLLRNVDQWIKNKLTLSTVDQFPNTYSQVLTDTLNEYHGLIDTVLWGEFKKQLDTHCKEESKVFLKKLSEAVTKLKNSMQNQFSNFGFFSPEKLLDQAVEQELNKLKEGREGHLFDMITQAATKLLHIYRDHNLKIIDLERELYAEMRLNVIGVYQEEMELYMKNAYYRPSELRMIHSRLKDRLVSAVTSAHRLPNRCDMKECCDKPTLKGALDEKFLEYKETNARTLKNMLAIATKIISNAKMEYNRKTEKILDDHPDGLDKNSLNSINNTIKVQVISEMEKKIRSEVRPGEPLEEHRKEMENYMDHYWPVVETENKKRLEEGQKRDEAIRQEQQRTKDVTERKQVQQVERPGGRDASFSGGSRSNYKSPSRTTEPMPVQKHQQAAPTTLSSPLIFHLKSTRILMAVEIDGQPHIQKNESGEQDTSACLAIHPHKNQFVYGTEALALLNLSNSGSGEDFVGTDSFWSLADCFLAGDVMWKKKISLGGVPCLISLEFLLAFILKKLKVWVEGQMNVQFSTAIVVVPFWLTSPQRIQVKDAMKLAGFSNSHLINEPSAAAYSMLLGHIPAQCSRDGKMMVLSENSDRIDACLYSYEGHAKKLHMIGHTANYLNDTEDFKKGFIQKSYSKVKNGCRLIADLITGEQERNDQDQTNSRKKIREACSFLTKKANMGKSEVLLCLTTSANTNRWQNVIRSVANEFGITPGNHREDEAVLRGAAALARNANIGIFVRDKPAFDLELMFETYRETIRLRERLLPESIRIESNKLPMSVTKVTYFQEGVKANNEIGTLDVYHFQNNHILESTLEISNEAIIHFSYATSIPVYRGGVTERVARAQMKWTTPNLSLEDLSKISSLLEVLIPSPQMKFPPSIKETSAPTVDNKNKANLLKDCEKMINSIERGQIDFSALFIRNQVLEQLETAKKIAIQTDPSSEQLRVSMTTVDKICQKYGKK